MNWAHKRFNIFYLLEGEIAYLHSHVKNYILEKKVAMLEGEV